MEKKEFLITVIIPVYNVEQYIEDTIKSVLRQTIGFKKNVQMVLVNDGSPDNSKDICMKYAKKYPDNIVYIEQINAGVSAARNNGLKYAKGKYINFLDSDDIWDKDTLKKAIDMLEEHNEIDLAAFRLKFFEGAKGYHWLDYKYTGDRIIDIIEEPQSILLHVSCSVIRKSALREDPFDVRLKISEDTKVLYEIIMNKCKYAVISSSNYNYRKRRDASSAIQTSRKKVYWYLDTLQYCHKELVNLSKEKFGKVIEYLQYFMMYDFQWRIKIDGSGVLDELQKQEYITLVSDLISEINDEVILAQRKMTIEYKLLALKIKYKNEFKKVINIKGKDIYVKDVCISSISELLNEIKILRIDENNLYIDGLVIALVDDIQFLYKLNEKDFVEEELIEDNGSCICLGENVLEKKRYSIQIPLDGVNTIEFYIRINDNEYRLENKFMHFSNLSNFKLGYYVKDKYLLTKTKNVISIKHNPNFITKVIKEIKYQAYLVLKRKELKVALMRFIYFITKPFMKKNIWLFCDREFMGRDSAELLFKYTNKVKSKDVNTYFVVNKNYDDYKRMKQFGKVVSYHTLKYKLLFLNAKYLISSHADGYVNNAFGKNRKYMIDLFNFKYIYLTHGILLHDSSKWLNRINKNIYLNVVTSPMECQSILNGNYYFKDYQLIKTGMPRHDNLFTPCEIENKILFMPSWRSALVPNIIPGTQRREYNPEFVNSDYFKFYDKLFNDERLLSVLKEYGYRIKFCVHPSFRGQYNDFKGNDYVEIAIDVDSQYETKSSKCLVTDYSSAACDFAYLDKPVIYANFDYNDIYSTHYYNKGYFDYDKDGFGPNCTNYEDTIKELIKIIKNGCVIEEKYKERCEKFFYHRDNKNCERVYDAIIEAENIKRSNR